MAMLYDVAQALKGAKTDGQSKTAAGGASSSVSVRHGTAQSVSDNLVEVLLDGSEDPINVSCETLPAVGQRISVVKQGGVYKVVSLGELPAKIETAQTAIGANSQAIADEVQARKEAVSDARKVAENFISQDSTGALTIADMNTAAEDRNSVVIDAYGMRVQEGGEDIAVFGEITTIGKETDFHADVSSKGMQFFDKTDTLCGTVAEYSIDGAKASGLLIKSEDWDKNIVIDVPTETEGIESLVTIDGDGVYMGRQECYVEAKWHSEDAYTVGVSGHNGIQLTSAAGAIDVTAAGAIDVSTSGANAVTLKSGSAIFQFSDGRLNITSTLGVITTPTSYTPSTSYPNVRVSTFGPINVLVFSGQSIGSAAWAVGNHSLFTLDTRRRPTFAMFSSIGTSTGANCVAGISSGGLVYVLNKTQLSAGTMLYGQLIWFATH